MFYLILSLALSFLCSLFCISSHFFRYSTNISIPTNIVLQIQFCMRVCVCVRACASACVGRFNFNFYLFNKYTNVKR